MAITIGSSNISSLQAQKSLGDATSKVASAYEQLSSGLRINSASDDAAGLAISTQLDTKARVYNQAIRNVNDGLSAGNIAEGALNSLKEISQRQLELAEQAANGTYSTKQRQALNAEAKALTDEYNRIVGSATFNGRNLFDPSLGSVIVQAGYGQSATLQLGITDQLQRAVGDGTFTVGATLTTGGTPGGLNSSTSFAVGDFNGDGKLDFVTPNLNSTATVFLGNGDGTFQSATTLTTGGRANEVSVGDFNGDGRLDVITADNYGKLTSFLGNGDGTFSAAVTLLTAGDKNLSVADLNGDGKLDVLSHGALGSMTLLIGNGDGTFGAQIEVGSDYGNNFTLGDLNGDGILDIVSSGYGYGGMASVHLGNGNGTFQAVRTFKTLAGYSAKLADFDGDGNLDIITSSRFGGIGISLGNGDGTFKGEKTTPATGDLSGVTLGDFNGDGITDVAVADYYPGALSIFIGNGDGTFQARKTQSTGGYPSLVIAGDFNGDGRLDLVANADYNSGKVAFYKGNGGFTSNAQYLNIATRQGALDALTTVNKNLDRIEAQLGSIGSNKSRFHTALNNLQTQSQNFTLAASRIKDADIAVEASVLVRTQILQQAAASVLAQANQQPALALKLLG